MATVPVAEYNLTWATDDNEPAKNTQLEELSKE
jgi:hypothetical protein